MSEMSGKRVSPRLVAALGEIDRNMASKLHLMKSKQIILQETIRNMEAKSASVEDAARQINSMARRPPYIKLMFRGERIFDAILAAGRAISSGKIPSVLRKFFAKLERMETRSPEGRERNYGDRA